MSATNIVTLAIADIVLDTELQPRAMMSEAVVNDYADKMRDGAIFPPVVVYDVDGKKLLSDGWHRVRAHRRLGRKDIQAEVRQGTRDDALRHALEFNAIHGLNFTQADKQRAIETYLKHPEWRHLQDREIARRLGVSPTTVGTCRARLAGPQETVVMVSRLLPSQRAAEPLTRPSVQSGHEIKPAANPSTRPSVQSGHETEPVAGPRRRAALPGQADASWHQKAEAVALAAETAFREAFDAADLPEGSYRSLMALVGAAFISFVLRDSNAEGDGERLRETINRRLKENNVRLEDVDDDDA
jgi:hypothetical protein